MGRGLGVLDCHCNGRAPLSVIRSFALSDSLLAPQTAEATAARALVEDKERELVRGHP
jgi:hypothetical protein